MSIKPSIYKLKGNVQPYAWGGYEYIAQLLGIDNSNKKPMAEYWLGAHPIHSSVVEVDGKETALSALINEHPSEILGERVFKKFGSLPYLFKILDVRQMLSIQVHPDKESAQKNFDAENSAGIPLTAYHRNYKDSNHKPELMVALSDFWLLHGFKPAKQLVETLSSEPDLEFLIAVFENAGYEGLYKKVMMMEQKEVNKILKPICDRILPLYKNGELTKEQEDFWAARAVDTYCKGGDYDRGIFSIYFFNLVHMKKGSGIFQPAGLPHAYLEGQNAEIMANSDNVLRAGLTDKHIDINELMKYVQFKETVPNIINEEPLAVETIYKSPAEEFELSRIHLKSGEGYGLLTETAEILLVIEGEADVDNDDKQLQLKKGEAVLVTAGAHAKFNTHADVTIFKATVPNGGKN